MAIVQLPTALAAQTGILPATKKAVVTDDLTAVTTAGFFNSGNLQGATIETNDVLEILYSYDVNTKIGSLGVFIPAISNGVITLNKWVNPGDITLPVVSGNFANFTGVLGRIHDAGYSASDPLKTKVVMANGAVVANRFAKFTDTAGTVDDATSAGTNLGDIYAGADAVAGSFRSYPATTATGYLALTGVSNSGAFNTIISNAAMGQTSTISLPDPGTATAEFIISDSAGTQHITSGGFQVDAGAISSGLAGGGFAGSMIAYSTTAANGSLRLLAVNSAGDYAVTISNASHGQASVISIPDGGQATSEFIIADSAGTQHITSGGLQVDGGSLLAGLSAGGTAGSLTLYPATTANGNFKMLAINAGADFDTTISNAASVGQDQVITIPDAGAATANFILSASSAASQTISSGLSITGNNNVQTTGGGQFLAGSSGASGFFSSYPTTAAKGTLDLKAVDNATGDFDTTISNATAVAQDQAITIPDSGAATANFLLDTGAANILAKQQFVGLSNVLTFGTGTWTVTRIAQGNYVSRHTPGDETSIIGIDITPAIRTAASKGFRLDSFDVIYAIAANPLDAHTVTLDRIAYADNVAVSITSVPITATLATATQANPYVTNAVVDTPAFDITADSKYIIELTVNNAAASEYDYYGIMLRFSETIG